MQTCSDHDVDGNRDLLMRFESLGGAGHGCEFGIFQRQHGAEPLGLLRWADLDTPLLTDALRRRLEGVGEEEHTELFQPENSDEWWTVDRRWHMAMRSFVKVETTPRDRMLAVSLKRQRYLRAKLIADLEAGDKIFVHKNMFATISAETLTALYEAVRAYGSNVLLYIAYENDAHPNGTVRVAAPGLLIGYIDHFSHSPQDELLDSAWPSLLAICREAHRLREAGAVREHEPTDASAIA